MNSVSNTTHIAVSKLLVVLLIFVYVLSCLDIIFPFSISRMIQVTTIVAIFLFITIFVIPSDDISQIGSSILVCSLYVLIYRVVGYSHAGWGNALMQISFFSSIAIAIYCVSVLSNRHCILVYYAIILILLFSLLQDVLINQSYSYFNSEDVEEMEELGSNVDWTPYSTMTLFLYSVSLLVLLNSSEWIVKLFHAFILLASLYYIIFCSARGSVTVLMFLTTFLLLYSKFSNIDVFFKILFIAVLTILLVALLFDINSILYFLIRISPNDRLTDRLYDLMNVYNEGLSEDSFSGRFELELISIRTWLQSPRTLLLGIGDQRLSGSGLELYYMTGIGGHSEIIDSLARFGLIGFSMMAVLYYRISVYIMSLFDDNAVKKQVKIILFVFVITAFTKAVLFHVIGITFCMLFPISSRIINKRQML